MCALSEYGHSGCELTSAQLASIPQDVAHYGSRVAEYIEKYTNAIASDIRDALDSATWLPESLRPPRPQTSPPLFARPPPPPQGMIEKTAMWISRNRTVIAVVVAFTGTSLYLVHRRKKAHARKRRVKKLPNGAKKEIVILACSSFHDPLTRSLALDLERRGYVVYVTVSSTDEDSLVQQEGKADLRPLWMDLTSTVPNPAVDIHPNLEPIKELLTRASRPSSPASGRPAPGSAMSNMTLAGVVVFPGSSGYPEGPLALLPPSDIVDTINTRLAAPILTVQQFLPLLANYSTDPRSPSSIVIAYPSIPHALSPPKQIPEVIVTSSLSGLAASLRREVESAAANITVSELKLGNFDLGSVTSRTAGRNVHGSEARLDPSHSAVTHWHSSQRAAIQRTNLGQRSLIKGSSAREFHNAVFDALAPPQTFRAFGKFEWQTQKKSETVFVGSGAALYDVVGKVMPRGLVAWMMGYRSPKTGSSAARGDIDDQDVRVYSISTSNPAWISSSMSSESGIWEKV